MTFNNSDGAEGCGNSDPTQDAIKASTGLDCTGDGIGIGNDDEITQSNNEALTVTFDHVVNILSIESIYLQAKDLAKELSYRA